MCPESCSTCSTCRKTQKSSQKCNMPPFAAGQDRQGPSDWRHESWLHEGYGCCGDALTCRMNMPLTTENLIVLHVLFSYRCLRHSHAVLTRRIALCKVCGKGKLPEQPVIVKARYFTKEAGQWACFAWFDASSSGKCVNSRHEVNVLGRGQDQGSWWCLRSLRMSPTNDSPGRLCGASKGKKRDCRLFFWLSDMWIFPKIVGFPQKSSIEKSCFSIIKTIHFGGVLGFSPIFGKAQAPHIRPHPQNIHLTPHPSRLFEKPCKILRSVAPGGATSWFLQYKRSRCLPQIEERVKVFQFQSAIFFLLHNFYVFLEVF